MTKTTIPLNKLTLWAGNVRKTGAEDGIGELAASIAAHGLLQSLVVRKTSHGKFAVIAGGRRYRALTALAGDGEIAADFAVPCHVVARDADAAEISLAENIIRAAMHPADQFEAFRDLIDRGSSAADVAARFGVSESIVVKRMKLGRVSPALLDIYRRGEMSLEQVQAFTLSDDHAAQEQAWASGYGQYPQAIRQALTEGEIPASDKRVRLVTLDAYEAAGGAVRRDLFAERGGGTVQDLTLLDGLVQKHLATAAEPVRAEGWQWVETRVEFDWQAREAFRRVHPDQVDLTDAETEEAERLEDEHTDLMDRLADDDGAAAVDPALEARIAVIEARIREIDDRPAAFTSETYAIAGAVVTIGHNGEIDVMRGLIRPEDATDGSAVRKASSRSPDALPASLIEELTAQKTVALQAELAARPDVALAAVVHALVLRVFYHHGAESCLGIGIKGPQLRGVKNSPAMGCLTADRDRWGDELPNAAGDVWVWCLDQSRERLLALLAFTTAQTVDAVQRKGDNPDTGRLRHADDLARAVRLDMTAWFTPTAENFFGRVDKPVIAAAIAAMSPTYGSTTFAKEKKAALAEIAERQVAGTGWLPPVLRIGSDQPAGEASIAVQLATAA